MNYFEPSFDSSCEFPDIYKELRKHSPELKEEFINLFPSNGEYGIYVPFIATKTRQVGATLGATRLLFNKIKFTSAENFWYRWNKFKKLKVFL